MLVLDGYFDESGTHDESETIAVAGFLAHADQWLWFEGKWREALKKYGLEFFHMVDFAHRAPGYDWPEDVRQERLGNLISIINKSRPSSFGVAFPKKLFDSVFTGRVREHIAGPYGFASWLCLNLASRELDEVPLETGVSYIFEDGARGKGEFLKMYEALPTFPGGKEGLHVLSLRFEDKRCFVPLQAADILAYELNLDRVRQFQPENRRAPLQLLSPTRIKWMHMTEPNLRAFAGLIDMLVAGEISGKDASSAAVWQLPTDDAL